MIGQQRLIKEVEQLIAEDRFPHFALIVGEVGSGKKTLVKQLFDGVYPEDHKAESIRKIVDMSYKVSHYTFVIPDAELLSVTAQNALLKVVEECPNDNYYILTVNDVNNILYTIKSRATVFNMDPYTPQQLFDYCFTISEMPNDAERVGDYCSTPGDVNKLVAVGALNFIDFVDLVIDNIAEVTGANAFKIAEKISFKDDDGKYDLKLFWKIFISECMNRYKETDDPKYLRAIKITSQYISDLTIRAINRQMLFDMWIISIREEWE